MYTVAALYKFSSIEDPNNLQTAIRKELKLLKIYGTILVGNEGLNGTISGQDGNLKDAIEFIKSIPVSYTHLRAHETSQDLVCRLLLEKKKRQAVRAR